MAKLDRKDGINTWHHVVNKGARGLLIFATDRDRSNFLRLLARLGHDFGVEVHAYCLMDNHYHLLVRSADGRLSEAMRSFGSSYARYFNRQYSYSGTAFRGRYFSEPVVSDAQLLQTSAYLHLNPVRAGVADEPGAFEWSSYGSYIGARPTPLWLHTRMILEMSSGQQSYAKFVEGRSAVTIRPVGRILTDDLADPHHRMNMVDQHLAKRSSVDVSSIRMSRPGASNPNRSAAVLYASDYLRIDLELLACHYGFNSIESARRVVLRARRQVDQPGPMSALIADLSRHATT